MIIVGLTGGIGSGKTTVAAMFAAYGVPVYIADDEAKKLMNSDPDLITEIISLFGNDAYEDGQLNRRFLADKIFTNESLRAQMNALVHPAVHRHFEAWKKQQDYPYVIYEAAILIENGGYKNCDYVILIVADKTLKMNRLKERDDSSTAQIEARMNAQWSDERKKAYVNFTLQNTTLDHLKSQVEYLHQMLLSME
ncbi:dephospho-CoA kinase [Gangjinia marincola]|uniref:Dephospho-CoA kinase n=1 Tax=Gangjinia marincola TaxID=578463 RepID=A0ABP3XTF3_9FLAO